MIHRVLSAGTSLYQVARSFFVVYSREAPNALSKDDAPPTTRMPAETRAANYRCRCYDDRRGCYDNRGRRRNCDRGCRRNYDWGRRRNYDWGRRCYDDWPIRPTPSIWSAVKAGTTSAPGTGAVDADE
jgi:hypothetical protein